MSSLGVDLEGGMISATADDDPSSVFRFLLLLPMLKRY